MDKPLTKAIGQRTLSNPLSQRTGYQYAFGVPIIGYGVGKRLSERLSSQRTKTITNKMKINKLTECGNCKYA